MRSEGAGLPLFLRLAADPLRWRLLTELAVSDLRVRELVEKVGGAQNLVSYHLRLLREGGLVSATPSTYDGRETYYHLDLDRCADQLAVTRSTLHPSLTDVPAPGPARQPSRSAQVRVLFICTGNSARSPLAEAILRDRVDGRWKVASAGSDPKAAFHPLAVDVLGADYGLTLAGPRPRAWSTLADEQFDCVISLCDKAREEWTRGSGHPPWTHWSIPDPAAVGGSPPEYRTFQRTAQEIDTRVGHLIAAITASQP